MQPTATSVRIWDLPTRLFHWAFAAAVIGALVTVKLGGLYMDWHVRFGLTALGLVLFRLIWGFVGPRHARFATFVRGPGAMLAYLRGRAADHAGHNPLGALSVLAMLAVIGVQAATGLFASDDIMIQGPLYGHVSEATANTLTGLHQANEWIIFGLLGAHLLAIAWYSAVRRRALVRAMITGNAPAAQLPPATPASQDGPAIWLRAAVVGACCAALVLWIQAQAIAVDMSFS
ncbi:cytochrome b/b6 domain-containing protein [Bordetella bronchiseptica]|uniref:cytochrome b/b6 domain-containing protein n=1 Tax=Bordetella bronchiseptica TaxID=518 RepID=UPI000461A57E|nr:cytochrome b/b6 domain-containing protein [Bordetella bronchiseptica]KDD17717.1 prokaryotic cytochrome b561 [Bordetella bronchiseptica MBORD731]